VHRVRHGDHESPKRGGDDGAERDDDLCADGDDDGADGRKHIAAERDDDLRADGDDDAADGRRHIAADGLGGLRHCVRVSLL
jgi:hypothetical protein